MFLFIFLLVLNCLFKAIVEDKQGYGAAPRLHLFLLFYIIKTETRFRFFSSVFFWAKRLLYFQPRSPSFFYFIFFFVSFLVGPGVCGRRLARPICQLEQTGIKAGGGAGGGESGKTSAQKKTGARSCVCSVNI